ncbi:MAG: AIM24 family protein [Pseudonocardiaceae bacterium]
MRSDLFAPAHQETRAAMPGLVLQNSKMLKIALAGEALVRQGAMVAYQGDVQFKALGSGGIKKLLKKALTGEGVPLMKVSGQGDVFVANQANDVHLIDLETPADALTVNGENVLAFEPTLSYDIRRVEGAGMLSSAGLFNCVFSGQGRIAITSNGTPVVLNVDQPTFADPQAAIAWSAALRTGFHRADQLGLGTLLGRRTGEGFTMSFAGQGFVIVQPSEELPEGMGDDDEKSGGLLGDLIG